MFLMPGGYLEMTENEAGTEWDSASATRYVRVTGVRKNAFVEFDFSFDDPSIYIELVLPFAQFQRFCDRHNVRELTAEQQAQVDLDKLKWRYGEPGVTN